MISLVSGTKIIFIPHGWDTSTSQDTYSPLSPLPQY